jgi:hypothetical protein
MKCIYFWSFFHYVLLQSRKKLSKIYLLSPSGEKLAKQLLGLFLAERDILSRAS